MRGFFFTCVGAQQRPAVALPLHLGACLSNKRGRDRGRFALRLGGADELGPLQVRRVNAARVYDSDRLLSRAFLRERRRLRHDGNAVRDHEAHRVHSCRAESCHALPLRPAGALGPQVVRLRPAPHCRTRILSYSLQVEPAKHFINWQQDPQANYLARAGLPETDARAARRGRSGRRDGGAQSVRLLPRAVRRAVPVRSTSRPSSASWRPIWSRRPARRCSPSYLAASIRARTTRTIDFLVDLNQRLAARHPLSDPHGARRADARGDAAASAPARAAIRLAAGAAAAAPRAGGALRLRLPDPADSRRRSRSTGPPGPTADFTDLHAWCEVYLPGAGWIGLDPTSGLLAGEGHIPLACTPEPSLGRADHRRGRGVRGRVRAHA